MQEDKKIQEMKQEIQQLMTKKDYYEVLGINKQDSQTQVKKAYKRLAMKFHPDKNKVEGSIDVFKKVTNAYSTLIDPKKKEHYDKFGPQQQRNPTNNSTHHRNYANQDFNEFDQVFRQFFNQPQNVEQNRGKFSWFTVFLIFWLGFKLLSYFLVPNEIFSLTPTSTHNHRLQTDVFKAGYYVQQQFFNHMELKKDVDVKVDVRYYQTLKSECDALKSQKVKLQYEAYQYSDSSQRIKLIEKAKNINLSQCKQFEKLQTEHSEYIRTLVQAGHMGDSSL